MAAKKFGEKQSFFRNIRNNLKWLDPFTYVEILLRLFHSQKTKPSFADNAIDWAVYIVFAAIFAFLAYTILGLLFGSSAPMIIVYSCSMEPNLFRGDIIGLQKASPEQIKAPEIDLNVGTLKGANLWDFAEPYPYPIYSDGKINTTTALKFKDGRILQLSQEGDIVMYYSNNVKKEIIHRVVAKIKANDGYYFLTKGDSAKNYWIDEDCFEIKYYNQVYRSASSCITLNPLSSEEIAGKAFFRIPYLGYAKLLPFDDLPRLILGQPNPCSGIA